MKTVEDYIRTIPDFPKPGIMFRDVTTLLADPRGFRVSAPHGRAFCETPARMCFINLQEAQSTCLFLQPPLMQQRFGIAVRLVHTIEHQVAGRAESYAIPIAGHRLIGWVSRILFVHLGGHAL